MHYMNNPTPAETSVEEWFGRRVSEHREAAGWSQQHLAEELGRRLGKTVKQPTITRIERGTRPTTIAELFALSEAFGVPVQSLLPGESNFDALASDLESRAQQLESQQVELEVRHREIESEAERIREAALNLATLKLTLSRGGVPPKNELVALVDSLYQTLGNLNEKIFTARLIRNFRLPPTIAEEVAAIFGQAQNLELDDPIARSSWYRDQLVPVIAAGIWDQLEGGESVAES